MATGSINNNKKDRRYPEEKKGNLLSSFCIKIGMGSFDVLRLPEFFE